MNFTRLPLPAEGLTFVIVMASFTVVTAHHLSHDFDFGFNHYARGIVSKRLCAGDRAGLAGLIGSLLGSLRASWAASRATAFIRVARKWDRAKAAIA